MSLIGWSFQVCQFILADNFLFFLIADLHVARRSTGTVFIYMFGTQHKDLSLSILICIRCDILARNNLKLLLIVRKINRKHDYKGNHFQLLV